MAFFSLTPQGVYLEEEFGLPVLFKLRGSIPPPAEIVIVCIDETSSRILQLPDNPEKWPRSYYAQLINKINQQSPAIIAFNMTFGESRQADNDQLLAQAMVTGKNVILSNLLKQKAIPFTGSSNDFKFERIIDSIPLIEEAALATAPLLLPKTATTVKQFWVYRNSAGDIATFPTTIFQQYILKRTNSEITSLLQQLNIAYKKSFPAETELYFNEDVDLKEIKIALKNTHQNTKVIEKLISSEGFSFQKKRLLTSWLSLIEHPDTLYLNYYGGAETFPTIPFYQALDSHILNPDLFRDKIVLVGYSRAIETEKSSGPYTVFSVDDTDSTSPIEIAATAVANLLENSWLKPLQAINRFLLIVGWGLVLCMVSRFFSYKQGIGLLLVLTLGYLLISYSLFTTSSMWLPLFIPLIIQLTLILTFCSVAYFLREKQERSNMLKAFSHYVPDNVAISMAQQQYDIKKMNHFGELMQGVCMSTDAGQYTALSENMEPENLHHFINQYYGVMFPLVKRHKGIVSDVVGDAMFAIWNATEQELKARTSACIAALEIRQAVESFNQAQPYQFPTRLGLNFGRFRLGNVGAAEHYEYRAVGDTVNTATRIEGLNKVLGTQILVTSDVIADLQHFITREIGFFMLAGKAQSVHVFELIGITENQAPSPPLLAEFSIALELFQQQRWTEAEAKWLEISRDYPDDGPTVFYLQFLKQNLHLMSTQAMAENQPTIIKIGSITTPLLLEGEKSLE